MRNQLTESCVAQRGLPTTGDPLRVRGSHIRVMRIIDRLNIGGPAKHVSWLTAGLNNERFQSVLITGIVPDGEGDMSYFADALGVKPIVIPEMSRELSWRDALVVLKLLRQMWRIRPDIVHTHKSKAGATGRLAALLYRWLTPSALWLQPRPCWVVHTYHGHTFHSYFGPARQWVFQMIERALARFCTDRIIVISQQQRREILEQFRIGQPRQFVVIPLGLDLDELLQPPCATTDRLRQAPDEVLIGIVGRLCEVKNHALFLDAAARLLADQSVANNNLRFVLVGDGHLRDRLQAHAQRLGIAERVMFAGFRRDALRLYADLDIVALTSLNEGTPLTLIEAMASGCAVAATEVGGVIDLMGARQTEQERFSVWEHGVTARSQDAEGMARALRFLIEQPAMRRQMGQRGRAYVMSHLTKERLLSDMQAFYSELVGLSAEALSQARRAARSTVGGENV
ncbi:MAG: glycosyltransferase [Acidobacteriota bacterium]|nr:glycosyltransferase [Blastocatellia bacterium]MDW8240541.1 glycosyltransferase [Acidobacteriota bacterium]